MVKKEACFSLFLHPAYKILCEHKFYLQGLCYKKIQQAMSNDSLLEIVYSAVCVSASNNSLNIVCNCSVEREY